MVTANEEILIVGGSLAGLTLALACAFRGVSVRVLERSNGHMAGGDSLSIDVDLVARTVGYDPREEPALPVVPAYRELTTWPALYSWLRSRAAMTEGIILEEGVEVTGVDVLNGSALLTLADGTQRSAPAVIGADGYRSVVRKAIAPQASLARYAGYLVWRGLVEESQLSKPVPWPSDGGLWIDFVEGYRLVAATLPGRDGSLESGHRQITFAWFDVHQEALLRQAGCLTADGHVVGTLVRGRIDADVRQALVTRASEIWPTTWVEAVIHGIRSAGVLSGAPIAEYKPDRLAHGPLAIIGDAAHVVSPMTGRGFLTGVEDAATMAGLLARLSPSDNVSETLQKYEQTRLPFIKGLVDHSIRLSNEYSRFALTKTNPQVR